MPRDRIGAVEVLAGQLDDLACLFLPVPNVFDETEVGRRHTNCVVH